MIAPRWLRLSAPLLICIGALVVTTVSVPAKVPGSVHCYRKVCHRVKTIPETNRLVGSTRTILTSYYDDPRFDRYNTGKLTSSGEAFDANHAGRVASSNFPDGTELLIWNPANGRTAHVRVNDFGPFHSERKLDATRALASELAFRRKGVVKLRVTVIAPPPYGAPRYRRYRRFPKTKGYLGVFKEAELAALADDLIAEAQRIPPPVPQSKSRLAGVSLPERKPAWRFASDDALVAYASTQSALTEGPMLSALEGMDWAGDDADRVWPVAEPLAPSAPASIALAAVSETLAARSVTYGVQVAAATAWFEHQDLYAEAVSRVPAALASLRQQGIGLAATGDSQEITPTPLMIAVSVLAMTALSLLVTNGGMGTLTARAAQAFPEMTWEPAPVQVAQRAGAPLPKSIFRATRLSAATNEPAVPLRARADVSVVGADLYLSADLRSASTLILEGTIEGTCTCHRLVIKPGGVIKGTVRAEEVTIGGTLDGTITAKRVRLESSAVVNGEVAYNELMIEGPATLNAECRKMTSSFTLSGETAQDVLPPLALSA